MTTNVSNVDSPLLRELVGRAGEIARGVLRNDVEREDREGAWPEGGMRALADAGLMGLVVPEANGGHGQGMTGVAAVTEQLARENPSAALCYGMHCVGTAVLAAKPTAHQREGYLEPIARGEHITTLALSEPGTGSHFWIPESRLEAVDGTVRLNGVKSFVTNGGHADSYVVSVVAPDETAGGTGVFSLVVLDGDQPGIGWGEPWEGFGMRANSSRTLELRDVQVSDGALLGEHGEQLWYVFEVVAPYFLMAMAGTYSGIAAECVELAKQHLGTRRYSHTGELLGAEPLLAHRLGGMWMRAESARQLVFSAARSAEQGAADALLPILACKAAASEAAVELANEAMTLAGGRGYGRDGKLARMLRDSRASHVMAPTTDVLLGWVGRALLKLPLL